MQFEEILTIHLLWPAKVSKNQQNLKKKYQNILSRSFKIKITTNDYLRSLVLKYTFPYDLRFYVLIKQKAV